MKRLEFFSYGGGRGGSGNDYSIVAVARGRVGGVGGGGGWFFGAAVVGGGCWFGLGGSCLCGGGGGGLLGGFLVSCESSSTE